MHDSIRKCIGFSSNIKTETVLEASIGLLFNYNAEVVEVEEDVQQHQQRVGNKKGEDTYQGLKDRLTEDIAPRFYERWKETLRLGETPAREAFNYQIRPNSYSNHFL